MTENKHNLDNKYKISLSNNNATSKDTGFSFID